MTSVCLRPERVTSEAGVVQGAGERDHLDRAHGRVPSLVPGLAAGTVDGLIDRLGRKHAERDRNVCRRGGW